MLAQGILRVAEELLSAELEHLRLYNRFLEMHAKDPIAPQVAAFRDEQLARIGSLQVQIRTLRDTSEAEM